MKQLGERKKLKIGKKVYLGHPQAEKLYQVNMILKAHEGEWELSVEKDDDLFKEVMLICSGYNEEEIDFSEKRVIKDTKSIMFVDYDRYEGLSEASLEGLIEACKKFRDNPDFLSFEDYTEKVLNDRLESLDDIQTIDKELAFKYVRYRDKYDADKKYSDTKAPYWVDMTRTDMYLFATEGPHKYNIYLGYQSGEFVGLKIQLEG